MADKSLKRRHDSILIVSILALIVFAVILLCIVPGKARRTSEGALPAPSPAETTLRNLTNGDVRYSVRGNGSAAATATAPRILRPGGIDRIKAEKGFDVIYESGGKELFFIAAPGKPYSFRYNEERRVRVYPGSHGREDAVDLAPYVQTPMPVVEKMLEMAALEPGDVLYDIGCGDGRIVITAAKTYGVRGVGIDILPELVAAARVNAKRESVSTLARFVCMDATKADLSEATVVTLYLLPESNDLLRSLLERDLRPGARVVSHGYVFTGWEDRLAGKATVVGTGGEEHSIFAYRIPAKPGRYP